MVNKVEEEYDQELCAFEIAVAKKEAAEQVATKWGLAANFSYDRLEILREHRLEALLEEQGLAICSHRDHHSDRRESDPKKLGIFPKDQMRLYYCSEYRWRGSEYTEAYGRETDLSLLCLSHFPKEPNAVLPPERGCKGMIIYSEVIEKDGKRITLVNNIDVTELPIKRYPSGKIYEYFGIPSLPNFP